MFDKVVDDLEQWQRILVKEFTSKLVDEIKAKSMAYRHDNWISLPDHCALEPLILSSTAGEMFQVSKVECRVDSKNEKPIPVKPTNATSIEMSRVE